MAQKHKRALAEELSIYEKHKTEWLTSYAGQFALIGAGETAGFFPSYKTAFEEGLKRFGLGREFLIKQVVEHEPVFVIY